MTEDIAAFINTFGETRWLSMKPVGMRVLDQLDNLKKYFLEFLPKQKGFRHANGVGRTERYNRISEILKHPLTEAYISFMVFIANDFEAFLRRFQFDQPMIHVLFDGIVELIRGLLTKFLKKKKMLTAEGQVLSEREILSIQLDDSLSRKQIDIGTRATEVLSNTNETERSKFTSECQKFFLVATEYLLKKLPHDNIAIRSARYLHPQKRTEKNSVNSISNLGYTVAKVRLKIA